MTKKLWGGRFKKKTDKHFEEFSKSIHYDYKLAEFDIFHSFIHIRALQKAEIITKQEANKLYSSLWEIKMQISQGKFKPDLTAEDIHTDIQNRVEVKLGSLARKLHTLRSRNDQIVFDEKWYCHTEALAINKLLQKVSRSLNTLAGKYQGSFIVGYTHTQRAQVLLFSDYIAAFCNMFERDQNRLNDFLKNLCVYVGSGALAGSAIPKEAYDQALKEFLAGLTDKFKQASLKIVSNSIDNVSDRDFIMEFLGALAILQMHISRLAQDFILYSTKEFNFLDLPEEFCTGSSLMPHKKNADFLELTRGSTGKVYGNLVSILTTMKGLPLTYNRDMQLDKEPLFSSVETVKEELSIMSDFILGISLKQNNINKALEDESLYATEIVEYLVFKGVAFKEAHDIVGKLILYCEDNKVKIKNMGNEELKKFNPHLNAKVLVGIMVPKYAVSSKKSIARKTSSLSKH